MEKVYKGQTLMIELIANIDLSAYTNRIKYLDPDNIEGQFVPDETVVSTVRHITKLQKEGNWIFWLYSTGPGDFISISTPVTLRVFREGE